MAASRARDGIPAGLGVAGARLWRDLSTAGPGHRIEFSASELVVLGAACRQADDIALLEKSLADSGPVVAGSKGQPKISGVVAELRLQRAALTRLVHLLAIPDGESVPQPAGTAAQRKARAAADKRWAAHARREASKHA